MFGWLTHHASNHSRQAYIWGVLMASLGRTVLARHRMARLWALGDRNDPSSENSGLVITDDDFGISLYLWHFKRRWTHGLLI